MEKIVIKQKRMPFLWLFLGASIFVIGCALMTIKHESLYYKIVGGIGTLFFGFGIILFGKNFFSPQEILIIDESGIYNNIKENSLEFVPWSDIKNFSIDPVVVGNMGNVNNFLISVNLKDEDKYIKTATGVRQKLMNANKRLGYAIYSINLTGADKKREDVLYILNEFLKRSGI
ncbi:STM3941 family protein [Fusobacterium sp. PH5-44]|uniref:STM3941 family protein n=1 Tax=unclassified Fusobacterium TaxID=2648384 RepID=UPI003D1F6AC1